MVTSLVDAANRLGSKNTSAGCRMSFSRGSASCSNHCFGVSEMLPEGPRRPCREHERVWRNYPVDTNLDDSWLEALNGLRCFDLINICEGHVSTRGVRGPHVYVRAKGDPLAWIVHHRDQAYALFERWACEFLSLADTGVEFGLSFTSRSLPRTRRLDERFRHEKRFVVRMHSRAPRAHVVMDLNTRRWFEQVVCAARRIDGLLAEQIPSVGPE